MSNKANAEDKNGELEPIVIAFNKDMDEVRSMRSKKTNKTSKSKKNKRERDRLKEKELKEKNEKIEYFRDKLKLYDLLHAIILVTGVFFGFI